MPSDPTPQTAWVEAKNLDEIVEPENVSKHESGKISKTSKPYANEGKPVLA